MKVLKILFLCLCGYSVIAQDGYEYSAFDYGDLPVHLYAFQIHEGLKVTSYTDNAYRKWQASHVDIDDVYLLCSAAFSEDWTSYSDPVGFTVDHGEIVNRDIDQDMDALVFVYPNYVYPIDLDNLESGYTGPDGSWHRLNPRTSYSDRTALVDAAVEEKYTIWQTQMLFSQDKSRNFGQLYYGKAAKRRMLAVCQKGDTYYNIIIDIPKDTYLNYAGKAAKEVLVHEGYGVHYIMNLDTGDKDIFAVRENGTLYYQTDRHLDDAVNIIIFHK